MTRNSFRDGNNPPRRTYSGEDVNNYRIHKKQLRNDFKKKCGYTDCLDEWFGGEHSFQIDHFLPQANYPSLKTKYSNLVYSCSYVNRAKSDDEGLYLDPCTTDYNKHFERNEHGAIVPKSGSEEAKYMYLKLKLYLSRYSLIWKLEKLEKAMSELKIIIRNSNNQQAKDLFIEVGMKYDDYKEYLRANR